MSQTNLSSHWFLTTEDLEKTWLERTVLEQKVWFP